MSSQSPFHLGHPPKAGIPHSIPLLLRFPSNPLALGFDGRYGDGPPPTALPICGAAGGQAVKSEPMSAFYVERLISTSPGAAGHLHSLTQAWADTLRGLVASLFMVRSKLCAHTCTTQSRPAPARGPSGEDGRVKPRRELRYRCSLIYKVPILRMLGASARYSRLCVPVETSTPPCCRKVYFVRDAPAGAPLA